MKQHLSVSNEDYLERIYELATQKGYVRVTDIANEMKIKPASVTRMLQKLSSAGYVTIEKYRGFTLTTEGKNVGKRIQKRHHILDQFLRLLDLPEHIITQDIEGLEHHLSDTTVTQLSKLIQKLSSQE